MIHYIYVTSQHLRSNSIHCVYGGSSILVPGITHISTASTQVIIQDRTCGSKLTLCSGTCHAGYGRHEEHIFIAEGVGSRIAEDIVHPLIREVSHTDECSGVDQSKLSPSHCVGRATTHI